MSSTKFSDETKALLGNLFPNATFQDDVDSENKNLNVSEIVKIFDTCMNFFRDPIQYVELETNEIFSKLWDKIAAKKTHFVVIDPDICKLLSGIVARDSKIIYMIKLPPTFEAMVLINPVGVLGELLFVAYLLDGYDRFFNQTSYDITKLDEFIYNYKRTAYVTEISFLKQAQTRFSVDLESTIKEIENYYSQYFLSDFTSN
jgi:hypothetical protein